MRGPSDINAATAFSACALVLWLSGACSPSDVAVPDPTTSVSGVGAGLVDDDAAGGAGGNPSGTGGQGGQGESVPVYVGVQPNPLLVAAEPATSSDVFLAELTALAAGVRVVFIRLPWSEFDSESLAAAVAAYRDKELRIVVSLEVVAGRASHRPESLSALAWNDPDVIQEMQNTIDQLLLAGSDEVDAILIGRRSDTYLAEGGLEDNGGNADGFVDFMTAAVGYLRSMGSADLGTAVGLTYQSGELSERYQTLLALGSVAAFSYFPGLGDAGVSTSVAVAQDLDKMVEMAVDRHVVLHELGFTSEATLESDAERQAQFFDVTFGALVPRRATFPYINVYQLHDVGTSRCEEIALGQSLEVSGPEMRYLCNAGLRDLEGKPKPSWYEFIEATAAFKTP